MLTVDDVLAAQRTATVTLRVDLWGGDVRVRLLTLEEQSGWAERARSLPDAEFAEAILAELVVDESGEPLLDGRSAEVLRAMPLAAIGDVIRAVIEAAGMVPDGDAAGKSDAIHPSGSGSG